MPSRRLLVLLTFFSAGAYAQWLNFQTPGTPRLPDGKPNLAAPVPRTADGKPDLSGARQRGVNNAQIALAWVLQQPGITAPIVGATKLPYLDDAMAALKIKLDAEELKALAEPYQPRGMLANL